MNGSLNVVIIDDNKELAEVIKQYLSNRGFNVKIAENARNAMSILEKSERVDVILLDLMLKDVHGLELLKSIRSHSKQVVIIIITGIKDLNTVIEAMKAGADDYLVKPFRLGELEEKINENLYKKAMEEPMQTLTADRAMEVLDTLDYSSGMLKFSFKDLNEMHRFLDMIKLRDNLKIHDVKVGEEYEVFVTIKR
ncbi:response regulator transcription factor [Candidatus Aciduliprofundum boonei]|uniref:Response regulator receiver protein n=1 Tax=Aciduliprofundum boonei (strain DSM 19572 / T469) TaxID=439481 RepID=B5IH54_ACIB4|nr:response regulator [Candidatus Aciduliprofundum boonei]ADD08891.1 response regulator receiver protein [Aciduliprofundum boonei T469]EDY34416.1 response regulator receiver domain protein [Aciduliprofundum boonei T469]HII54794.1 response regulator [Candidatus Aciduliprofundum boonei]